MCRFNLGNFRVEKTCPHHVLEQIRIRMNEDSGFQSFCVSCHEMVSWSTKSDQPYRRIEGPVTELSERDRELLK